MSPKERARGIVELFWTEVEDNEYVSRKMSYKQAKQCALLSVYGIINANPYKWVPFMGEYSETVLESNKSYWLSVQEEIENMGGEE